MIGVEMDTQEWDKQLISVDKLPIYSSIDGHLIGYIKPFIIPQEEKHENKIIQENDQGTV